MTGLEYIEFIRQEDCAEDFYLYTKGLIANLAAKNKGADKSRYFENTFHHTAYTKDGDYLMLIVTIHVFPANSNIEVMEAVVTSDVDDFIRPGMEAFQSFEKMKEIIYKGAERDK